ncbi:MAG TPA: hypothetical protein PLZ03_17325, partial [Anaerolineales bacterium]|nr:hypothetical protein [Anaerolineales bacterium]
MTNTINQISRGYGLSALNTQTNQAESTSDFLSSFKDIISTMTMVNGGMSTGQQLNSTINDLMSPLLMLILLEKLVELQVEDDSGSVNTTQET